MAGAGSVVTERIHNRSRFFHAVACLLCVAAVFAPAPACAGQDEPFRIPKEEFRRSVTTIALEPLRVEEGMPASAELRQQVEATMQTVLGEAGFRVVPPSAADEARRQVVGRLGGLYDPITGRADAEKLRTADRLIASELARLHGADAVLTPLLVYDSVQADFEGPVPELWPSLYAVGERVVWRGQPMKFSGAESYPQKIVVSSIVVRISDLAVGDLYIHDEPIEWTRVYALRTYQVRPGGELQRPEVVRKAIEQVLAPLRPGPDTSATPK
jgi:hypothetical protein